MATTKIITTFTCGHQSATITRKPIFGRFIELRSANTLCYDCALEAIRLRLQIMVTEWFENVDEPWNSDYKGHPEVLMRVSDDREGVLVIVRNGRSRAFGMAFSLVFGGYGVGLEWEIEPFEDEL